LAQTAKDEKVRAQLTAMAERSLALAQRPAMDLEGLLKLFNEELSMPVQMSPNVPK
jgi:hypothetical protein